MPSAPCGATRSRAPAASASSPSSTPTRWARTHRRRRRDLHAGGRHAGGAGHHARPVRGQGQQPQGARRRAGRYRHRSGRRGRRAKRLTVLRAVDKLDRLGPDGVRMLLGKGRKDESRRFHTGRGPWSQRAIDAVLRFVGAGSQECRARRWPRSSRWSVAGARDRPQPGLARARPRWSRLLGLPPATEPTASPIDRHASSAGSSTTPAPCSRRELTFEVQNEDGQPVRFGSVGGGGRYDDLVARFTGQQGAGHRLLHRRVAPAGGAGGHRQDRSRRRRRPRGRAGHGQGRAAALPEADADAAPGRHPRRDVSGHRRHEGADEVRRQARRPCVVIQGGDEVAPRARCRSRT